MARARATDQRSLIRAAARVFRSKGYRNTTIDDIAEAAGVSRPTVYSYAKSKRWLLDRIVDEALDDIEARLEADLHVGANPRDRLRAVINTYVESTVANRMIYPIISSEENELSRAVLKRQRVWEKQINKEFRELLGKCIDSQRIDEGLNLTVAANLVLTMLTSLYRWYDAKEPIKPAQLTDQILTVIDGVLDHSSTGGPAVCE